VQQNISVFFSVTQLLLFQNYVELLYDFFFPILGLVDFLLFIYFTPSVQIVNGDKRDVL